MGERKVRVRVTNPLRRFSWVNADGMVQELPESVADEFLSRGFARVVEDQPVASPRVERAVAPQARREEQLAPPEWTAKVPPDIYLRKWPEGPQSDLAREHLAAS